MNTVELEREAVQRLPSAQDLPRIIGDMASGMRQVPADVASKLYPALMLLVEVQALLTEAASVTQLAGEPQRLRDVNAEHCARIWNSLVDCDSGERAQIIMERTGWPSSSYYRYRDAAIRAGLLRALP